MENIEVEVRAIVSKEEYERLLDFMTKNAKLVADDEQDTWYFSGPMDVRSRRTKSGAKMILKAGKLFDAAREEVEIHCDRDDFAKIEKLFTAMGYPIDHKWFQHRHTFEWKGVSVMLGDTLGYGYFFELEKITTPGEKDAAHAELEVKAKELGVTPTPKEELKRRHEEYRQNWRKYFP